jgi:exosortase K
MNLGSDPRWRVRAENVSVAAFALGLAWGLKDFYSRAGFDDLLWVLAPTAKMVEWLSGTSFELEPHRAYLSRDRLYEIIPACAGVNFMIAAFCSLSCGLVHTRPHLLARVQLVAASALAAYAATLLANATRIVIAVRLHETGASLGTLTPSRLHAAEGVAIYFLFLCLVFALGARVTGAGRDFAF